MPRLPILFVAAALGGCALSPLGLSALPLVHADDAAAHAARVGEYTEAAGGFARYDRDGDGVVGLEEWVEENWRYALTADLDDDGVLDRYEAMLYRDLPARRHLEGQAAIDEFDAFWRGGQKHGKLGKAQLAAVLRTDFEAADADRNGALDCGEVFAPRPCPAPAPTAPAA